MCEIEILKKCKAYQIANTEGSDDFFLSGKDSNVGNVFSNREKY